ncbi:tRNA (adenosine(37)-N6)-dimethylallyltransferase MiaA [Marinibacterium profundimaris]|uniref:tRNA dimethylallyltransferase n=1 Tax=Marinibacterium profundimaris TaxID=1679460 RepID=A0A225NRJ0_9RHOB|nr:tRNA (adenosine(37)-N6)-dimethylallyltransferase MiaA [Marinibacterium profundimaris]OWU77475.1 tRNA delta(2)-isopentenylpyrophosphate transferase [Marinibacterium profundimaris]
MTALPDIPETACVLIAGPTASGKSALALEIAASHGGVVINADASQVYGCWRVITARPSAEEEARVPHALYGHVDWRETYSAGAWLRDISPLVAAFRAGTGPRPIVTGGTGLYFRTLTRGMAEIPPTPPEVRAEGDALSPEAMIAALDPQTRDRIDLRNPARVQRAWEVQRATGRGLAAWQDDTPPPLLPLSQAVPIVVDADKAWLEARIRRRFDLMLEQGALDEVRAMRPHYDPALPAFRAIGVPELVALLDGEIPLDAARERASVATRQFAKRQRTWFRSNMSDWHRYRPAD